MSDLYYDFVIDTNSYAGNFERELCLYITGHDDVDSSPDEDDFEEGSPERWLVEHTLYTAGGDGDAYWSCPMELYLTPPEEKDNNSVGIHLDEYPPEEVIQYMKLKAKEFDYAYGGVLGNEKFSVLGFRLLQVETVRTKMGEWD